MFFTHLRSIAFLFFGAIMVLFLIKASPYAHGQTTVEKVDFFWSWQALSYAPKGFLGKILPAPNTPLVVAFEIIENNEIADISNDTVYWYVDNKFVDSGRGLRSVRISSSPYPGVERNIRVQVNNFKGRGSVVTKSTSIPTGVPEIVIESPFPENKYSVSPIILKSAPYAFNIKSASELIYVWEVNGKTPTNITDPETLIVGLTGTQNSFPEELRVNLSVENPKTIFEATKNTLRLIREITQ